MKCTCRHFRLLYGFTQCMLREIYYSVDEEKERSNQKFETSHGIWNREIILTLY